MASLLAMMHLFENPGTAEQILTPIVSQYAKEIQGICRLRILGGLTGYTKLSNIRAIIRLVGGESDGGNEGRVFH